MSSATRHPAATLADLERHDGKAELIAGRIVPLMPTGHRPNLVAFRIARSLDDHARATARGVVYTDNMGFTVPELASGRQSFSPDAAYHVGPPPADEMDFVAGPPTLAVEVRSKADYGPAAESAMVAKRADYFQAAPWPSGTWTRAAIPSDVTLPLTLTDPSSSSGARQPRPGPPSPAGGWLWMTSSPDPIY